MTIRGDLLSVDLSNVFQMLALNRKRGILTVQNRENVLERRDLILEEDRIAVVDIPETHDLAAVLLESGDISYDVYSDARQKSGNFQIGATDYLLRRRVIDEDMIARARRHLQEEAVLEIFLWTNVSFALDEEAVPPENADRMFVVIDQIVMEAARRQDEWRRVLEILGSAHDIYEPMPDAAEKAGQKTLPPVVRAVLDRLDGVSATPQLLKAMGLPRYFVDLAILNLLEEGLIRKLEVPDLVAQGDRLLQEGRADEAVRLLKAASHREKRSIDIHRRLAEAYRAVGRIAKAAQHEKFAALVLAREGDIRGAYEAFRGVTALLPTDFRALERATAYLAQRGGVLDREDRALIEQALKLFTFNFETKQYDAAEKVLKSLLVILKDDTNLDFAAAKLYAKTGRIPEAVEQYMRLAGRLYDLGDYEGALGAYRMVVSVDPKKREMCAAKMDQIINRLATKARRRAVGMFLLVAAVVVAMIGTAYGIYHFRAEAALRRVEELPTANLDQQGWAEHAGALRIVAKKYPMTRASFEAKRRAAVADRQSEEWARRIAAEKERLSDRRAEALDRAKVALNEALASQRRRLFARALEFAKTALAAANEAHADAWIREQKVESLIAADERQIAWENDCIARHLAAWESGDLDLAFTTAREMLESDDGRSATVDSIKVVSPEIAQKIRLPIRIESRPEGKVVIGTESHDTPYDVVLDRLKDKESVFVSREGYVGAKIELSLTSGPRRRIAVLEHQAVRASTFGHRIMAVRGTGSGYYVVGADGFTAFFDGAAPEPLWRWMPQAMLQVTHVVDDGAGRIGVSAIDGRFSLIDAAVRGKRWTREKCGAKAAALFAQTVCLWTNTDRSRLETLAADDGHPIASWDVPFTVQEFRAGPAEVAVSSDDGRVIIVDPASPNAARTIEGTFARIIGATAKGWYLLTRTNEAVFCAPGETRPATVFSARRWTVEPALAGDMLIAATVDEWWTNDGSGPAKSSAREAINGLDDATVHGVVGDDLILLTKARRLFRVGRTTGAVRCAYAALPDVLSSIAVLGDDILVGFADDNGKIETHSVKDL